jgi:hypothetical protein
MTHNTLLALSYLVNHDFNTSLFVELIRITPNTRRENRQESDLISFVESPAVSFVYHFTLDGFTVC